MSGLETYKGAIHIHTRYSDGSGSMEEVIGAARTAGLDFVIITDHNTLAAKNDGWEGWHDGVLVIVGAEVTPPKGGHIVALGVRTVEGYEELSETECLSEITRQGGVAFIAHPEGKRKRQFNVNLQRWRHWDTPLFAGMEIWSFMHDWIKDLHLVKLRRFHRDPLGQIVGADPWVLAAWDALGCRRPVAGVAGLDAHARRVLFKRWNFFPYEFMFRTTLTYVRTPPLVGRGDDDAHTIVRALARGAAFAVYEILGEARDFRFEASAGQRLLLPGETLAGPTETIDFNVSVPAESEIRLLCGGNPIARAQGSTLRHQARDPGPYRVEVLRDGRPWIYSNPVYIRPEQAQGETDE